MEDLHALEDDRLLAEIRQGTRPAFEVLYKRYWREVYSSALVRIKDTALAQDITQDIFLSLWVNRETLDIDNIPAYFHVAVRNRVLKLLEKQRRYVPIEDLLFNRSAERLEQPDAMAASRELLEAYQALVASLPAQRRKIFSCYYDEGLSTEDISRQLQLSRKTVQNQLGRAVTALRAGLSHLSVLLALFLY